MVYLYTGPEAGEKNDAVKAIKTSLKKKYGQIEESLYYATESSPTEYLSILQNENLFSDATCIVIKNADAIKKPNEISMIIDWIQSGQIDKNVLILISDEYSINSKLDKAIPPSNKKIFWELSETRRHEWIKNFFSKNGYSIEDDAVNSIVEMFESNTETLKSECSRFFPIFQKDHLITCDDVDSVLFSTREENAFTLFDTMADYSSNPEKILERTLMILQKIRLSKENQSFLILAGLASCYRKLALYHKLLASGMTDDFNLKKNGFSSKKMKNQYANAAKTWSPGQSHAILASIAECDMAIRSNGSLLEDIYLQKLIYEIVVKKGASSAKYE